jgi:aryl carrier-like protein
MENNNNFIELQSNFKGVRVEVDLVNLPTNPCLRKKK